VPAHHRPFLALALRLAAALAISTLFMLVKLAARSGVALPEIMFWRQAVSLPLLLGWLGARRSFSTLATTRMGSHARRATLGMVGMLCNFTAAILLPLPVSTILGFTTPLFAVILTGLMLPESVGRWRWLAVLLGFAGVLAIAPPGAMAFSHLGATAGLASGFMVAIISLQIRDLARTEAPTAIVFYFALFGTAMMAPLLPFFITHHTGQQWLILLAMGTAGTLAQLLATGALRFGAVATVVVMDYTALVWTTLYGWRIFSQLPPATTWLGAPLIVAAGLVITWREHRLLKARPPAEDRREEEAPSPLLA
jgi:drug/metabolite transporter (DMT)-like permease